MQRTLSKRASGGQNSHSEAPSLQPRAPCPRREAELLVHRTNKPRPNGAVSASELESDVLAFLAERYDGRHLDIEVAQLGLSNVAHKLILAYLRSVGVKADDRRAGMR